MQAFQGDEEPVWTEINRILQVVGQKQQDAVHGKRAWLAGTVNEIHLFIRTSLSPFYSEIA